MIHLSLFSGIGGFDLGFDRAGMTTVGQVENDAQCVSVLERWWPDVPRWSDVRDFRPDGLLPDGRQSEHHGEGTVGADPEGGIGDGRGRPGNSVGSLAALPPFADVVSGGFPCQDVSVAGKRAGLAGSRSGLWWEFYRILAECRPSWAVVENVPGLLSSNGGRDFATILGGLGELGYGLVWRVLDAQWFGVAQRRRRVFIVGHLGNRSPVEVLDLAQGCTGDSAPSRQAGKAVAALTSCGLGGGGPDGNLAQAGPAIQGVDLFNQTLTGDRHVPLRTAGGHGAPAVMAPVECAQNARGEVRYTDKVSALSCGGGAPGQSYPAAQIGSSVRRLTPVECARLQGFPDNWNDHLADTHRYRQYGNAVCVPVVEWIGWRIMKEGS